MLKTSTMPQNRNFRLFMVLVMTAVLFFPGSQSALGQDETTTQAPSEGQTVVPEESNGALSVPTVEAAQPEESEPVLPPSSSLTEKLLERFEKLPAGLLDRSLDEDDADQLFQDVDEALGKLRHQLHDILSSLRAFQFADQKPPPPASTDDQETSGKTPGSENQKTSNETGFGAAEQQSTDLVVLYGLRTDLLPLVSPRLRDAVTGTGIEGVQAFKEEIDYLLLILRIRLQLMPQTGRQSLDRISSAPVPVLLVMLQVIFACFIFYWWRRWAKKGIPSLRTTTLGIKPRKWIHSWSAKMLWYVNRVRSPVEWGFLFYMLLGIVRTSKARIILDLLWTNARLILVAWFVVLIVDAMSTRGAAGLRSDTAKLRLRSFWLIAVWALIVSLGLGITEDIAGKGTIYAWVWILSKVLVLPVLFLLVRWWRPEVYLKLEAIQNPNAFVQKICQNRKGLSGFMGAVLGAAYLMVNGLRRLVLRLVATFEGGRYFIANLSRLEAILASEREPQKIEGDPISDAIRDRFFDDNGGTVESLGQKTLQEMTALVEKDPKGAAVIVTEHGGGKTFLIKRLANQFEGRVLHFSCPPGGFKAFKEAFARVLDLDSSDLTADSISRVLQEKAIRIIAIDNIHRLSRPAFGGQQDMDLLPSLSRDIQGDVFWFLTLDWSAWQYISRVRDSKLFLDKVIRMPLWSEEQIRELIELRTAHAGIEPNFEELALPSQFEGDEHQTLEDRNRFGFFRILWNASDGNPVASLHLWTDALRVAADGSIKVTLPQLPDAGELDKAGMTILLILRVIAQSGMASLEQIVDSLKLPENEVAGALNLAHNHQWVEKENDHYRLAWKWFRSIMRILSRQNLLVR